MDKKWIGLLSAFLVFFVSNIGQPARADTNWKEDLNKSMKLLQKKDETNLPDNRLLLAVFQKHLGEVEKTQTLRKSIQRLEEVSRKNG